jgi:D-arabinitol dehydrogenase (NADP+)
MQAVIFEGPGSLKFTDVPQPIPGEGQIRLRVLLAGICSTDVHIFHGRLPVKPPRILGHELAGVVDAVGPQVSKDWLGKICGVKPARFCGSCSSCRRGYPELCLNFACLGNTQDGGYAEYTIIGNDQIFLLPNVEPENLVWLEPLACVMHALQTTQAAESDSVLIIGAGTLGRLMSLALRAVSSTRIAIVDPNQAKIDQACSMGTNEGWVVPRTGDTSQLDQAIRSWAPGGPQVVIDTTGLPIAVSRALRWVGLAGKILLFGVPDPQADLVVKPGVIFSKELKVEAAAGMTPASFDAAAALLQSGKINPSGLVSAVISLDQVPDVIKDGSKLAKGKVLIRPMEGGL